MNADDVERLGALAVKESANKTQKKELSKASERQQKNRKRSNSKMLTAPKVKRTKR
jgi:hypothetical protein